LIQPTAMDQWQGPRRSRRRVRLHGSGRGSTRQDASGVDAGSGRSLRGWYRRVLPRSVAVSPGAAHAVGTEADGTSPEETDGVSRSADAARARGTVGAAAGSKPHRKRGEARVAAPGTGTAAATRAAAGWPVRA